MVFRVRLKKYINTRLAGGVAGVATQSWVPCYIIIFSFVKNSHYSVLKCPPTWRPEFKDQ